MAPTKTAPCRNPGSTNNSSRKMSQNQITVRKASKKTERAEKPIFKGLTLSIAGTIISRDPKLGDTVIPHEHIAKWFTVHGGSYEREVTEETTHLICSIEEYKKKGTQVQRAWNFSTKSNQCQIVVFDWLEDSLVGKTKKKMFEKGYTLDRTIKRIAKGKKDHVAFRKSFEDGVRASKELCNSRLHKVYFDADGFEYKVVLSRIDLSDERVKKEIYTLYLSESFAIPHTYMCGAKLSPNHRPTTYYREECHPKEFKEAMRDFKSFFFKKTNVVWDERLEGIKVPGAFVYTPPVLGRPVGLLPFGYVRPGLTVTKAEVDMDDVVYDTDSDVDDSEPESPTTIGRQSSSPEENDAANEASSAAASDASQESSQEKIFDGYGYQPNIPDRRRSASGSPSSMVQFGDWADQ